MGDADAMVCERSVHAGNFNAGHVAGDAFFLCDGAGCPWVVARGFFIGRPDVAGEAVLIVGSRIQIQLLMRVVASGAGESGVAFSGLPAAAAFQAIGLEANVDDAGEAALHDVSPGAVAGAAEIDGSKWIEFVRVKDSAAAGFDLSGLHSGDVGGAGTVAGFAGNSGRDVGRRIESAGVGRTGGVAGEAAPRFVSGEPPAQCRVESVRSRRAVASSEVEGIERAIETEAAFVKSAVVLVDVSLALVAEAESPLERLGERILSVGHGVGECAVVARDFVAVGWSVAGDRVAAEQHLRVRGWSGGLRHRHVDIAESLLLMALRALGCANVIERARLLLWWATSREIPFDRHSAEKLGSCADPARSAHRGM